MLFLIKRLCSHQKVLSLSCSFGSEKQRTVTACGEGSSDPCVNFHNLWPKVIFSKPELRIVKRNTHTQHTHIAHSLASVNRQSDLKKRHALAKWLIELWIVVVELEALDSLKCGCIEGLNSFESTCYAHCDDCGVVWCGVVWCGERALSEGFPSRRKKFFASRSAWATIHCTRVRFLQPTLLTGMNMFISSWKSVMYQPGAARINNVPERIFKIKKNQKLAERPTTVRVIANRRQVPC